MGLRGIGLLTGSRFLALRLALAFHFFPLPATGKLTRANPAPNAPQSRPVCPSSRTRPRRLGNRCRFARINVPVGLQASKHAYRQRTNNSLRLVHAHVSRLKRRTPHASRHGGAGVRLAARFFPIIHHTPHAIFCLYAATPHLTHIVARLTGH